MSKQWGSLDDKETKGLIGAGKLGLIKPQPVSDLHKCIGCPSLIKGRAKQRCKPCQYDHFVANRKKYAKKG